MPRHSWLQARFTDIRPKAIAALVSYFQDIDLAEESFSLACVKALDVWQKQGLPDDPFAWLLTVARNAGRDIIRKNKTRDDHRTQHLQESASHDTFDDVPEENEFRDDVLRLLFICCHPKLSIQDQSALALKIIIGLSVEEIACAFLIKPKTMEQRITRAKKTVSKDNIPFESPDLIGRSERLKTVSLMLYLLFNEGWSASSGDVQIKVLLCEEAIYLTRLLLNLFPSQTETMGLLALMLFQHAKYPARIDDDKLILLEHQNRSLWNSTMIAEAHVLLEKALRHGTPGSFQIQAAIAGVHSNAKVYEATDWAEIERLYDVLYEFEPTPIVKLNHAVSIAKTKGPAEALKILDGLGEELQNYRWFHSTRAAFLFELGQKNKAKAAYQTALSLTPTEPEQAILREKILECEK
ncbi:RNA polymerase sigma factor [Kiloniella litopenaei]|uniref:RNA polymerase sigma factor n=1 Tax=Kiloniella litopenaei TaxID=1549748 RepID=UPI003BA93194